MFYDDGNNQLFCVNFFLNAKIQLLFVNHIKEIIIIIEKNPQRRAMLSSLLHLHQETFFHMVASSS
jgi:hypothetical protein